MQLDILDKNFRGDVEIIIANFIFEKILDNNLEFTARDLERFVVKTLPYLAPATPCRILRRMRLNKKIDYKVIDKMNSLYRIIKI